MYSCLAENLYGRNEHVIYLAVQERPDAPGSLEVVEVGSRSVRLAWKKPFDGNNPLLGYVIQYQPTEIGIAGKSSHMDWEQPHTQNLSLSAVVAHNK